jgi:type VI protein secretion system component Hcp
MQCDGIEGSYDGTHHNGWSEVYEFSYNLGEDSTSINITKPADKASNMLYYRYLQCRFKDAVSGSDIKDRTIAEINLELCRRGDLNNDGRVDADEWFAFVKYRFIGCRILSYKIAGGSDEDAPEEEITVGFKEMYMMHHRPNDPSLFGWNFRKDEYQAPPGNMTRG